MNRGLLLALIGAFTLMLGPVAIADTLGPPARAARAGAGASLERGLDGARANPANLAWADNPWLSVGLFDAAVLVGNDAIDLDLYNRTTGAQLDAADKREILEAIPEDGLTSQVSGQSSVSGLQFGRTAVFAELEASGSARIPHEVFELVLMGNSASDSLRFDSAEAEAYSVAALRIATAVEVGSTGQGPIHVGVSMGYLQAVGYSRLDRLDGHLTTRADGMRAAAVAEMTTASGGTGLGFDLGVAAGFGPRWRVGLTLRNAYARVRYDRGLQKHLYSARLDSLDVATLEEIDGTEDLYATADTTLAARAFTVSLPRRLHLSVARQGERFALALDLEQGLENRAGTTTRPRAALGIEWRALSFLPLRAGLSAGGRSGRIVSGGFGLHLGPCRLDLAAGSSGEWIPGSPRGLHFAAGLGLQF